MLVPLGFSKGISPQPNALKKTCIDLGATMYDGTDEEASWKQTSVMQQW